MMSNVKISILGDICPTEDYRALWDTGAAFSGIAELIKDSDLAIVNLECPATSETTPVTKCGPCLKAEPKDMGLVARSGFNVISLANNHVKDFGEDGVLETLKRCEKYNLTYVGAGANTEEASKARFFAVEDKKICVISFAEEEFNLASKSGAGANLFDPYTSLEYIAECKKRVDYMIVLYHGGIEHYRYPSAELRKKCHAMVRFGADLVLCQHSHCIGTFEEYEDGHILYGQGNGVYGVREGSPAWNEGLLVDVYLGEDIGIAYTHLTATSTGIVKSDNDISRVRLAEIKKDSERLSDAAFLDKSWREFCLAQGDLDRPLFYAKDRVYIKANRILKNKLFKTLHPKKRMMVTMNFMRCDALREVMTTILESDVYGE